MALGPRELQGIRSERRPVDSVEPCKTQVARGIGEQVREGGGLCIGVAVLARVGLVFALVTSLDGEYQARDECQGGDCGCHHRDGPADSHLKA